MRLVLDWDGTVTDEDTLVAVISEFRGWGGLHGRIEPVLARERVSADVLAHRVDARPDGWKVLFRTEDVCSSCGQPCKRDALPDGEIVYVGDGYSDRCAALAADRVFARDGLAR